jgi:hypothetical protein
VTERLWERNSDFRKMPIKSMVLEVRGELLGHDKKKEEIRGYKTSSMTKVINRTLNEIRKRNNRNIGNEQ